MQIHESYLDRRRFLCGMIGGGATTLALGAAIPLAAYVGNLREEPPPPFLAIPQAEADLPPGKSKLIMYGRLPALLIKTPEGTLRAFVATCTHFDCIVGYRESENRIFCACHEGFYDVEGNVTAGPPPRPLRRFHSQVQDGKLFIALEKENLEKALRTTDA
jgi:Rieske Fe-S protein